MILSKSLLFTSPLAPEIVFPVNGCKIGLTGPYVGLHVRIPLDTSQRRSPSSVKIRISRDAESKDIVQVTKTSPVEKTEDRYIISQEILDLLTAGQDYYVSCKYVESGKESVWSRPIKVTAIDGYNEKGCVLYRHAESGAGTVIEYLDVDSAWKRLVVPDANARSVGLKFYFSGTASTNFGAVPAGMTAFTFSNSNLTLTGSTVGLSSTAAIPDKYDNYAILKFFGQHGIKDLTAKANCDLLIARYTLSYLKQIQHCRSQTIKVNGIDMPCDLPNHFQASILYILSDKIDELDPTGNGYANLKLGRTNTTYSHPTQDGGSSYPTSKGRMMGTRINSCTLFKVIGSTAYWRPGIMRYDGCCTYAALNWINPVVPILEID